MSSRKILLVEKPDFIDIVTNLSQEALHSFSEIFR